MADDGAEGVVCITLSSKLSATYQAAVMGAESVADRIRVRVVDSLLATMAEGLTVLDAVAAAEAGGDLEVVERAAVSSRGRILLFGALESLDNLRKGGRLGSAQALLGGLLDIKPVLEIRDGVLELESRPRTRSRSFERLTAKVREAGELDRIAVVHAAATDVDSFVGLLATLLPRDRISVGWLGPVIGTHVGRGTVAVAAAAPRQLADGASGSRRVDLVPVRLGGLEEPGRASAEQGEEVPGDFAHDRTRTGPLARSARCHGGDPVGGAAVEDARVTLGIGPVGHVGIEEAL